MRKEGEEEREGVGRERRRRRRGRRVDQGRGGKVFVKCGLY